MARRRSVLLAATLALLAVVLTPAAEAGSRIEREFELGSGGEFLLDSDLGSITLTGTGSSMVRVVITSRREEIESDFDIRFEATGGRVEVHLDKKGSKGRSWFNWSSGSGLKFEIEVPRATEVDLDTAGGSIQVDSLDRDVRLDTSGGSIRATEIDGDVLADTSGGSITVEDVDGDVNADTSGGAITVEHVRGSVRADTSGGSITIDDVDGDIDADTSGGPIRIGKAGGRVVAGTSGGSISVSFVPGNASGGDLSTSGGGITVSVDPSVGLEIDASASGGTVSSDLPVTVKGRISKSAIRGTLGSGGATLKMRTSGGRVRIQPD